MITEVNGINLNVEDSGGDGSAVLLVHGFPDSSRLWRHQVPALTTAGYRVLTMDLRGYGESDKPPGADGRTDGTGEARAGSSGNYGPAAYLGDVTGVLDQAGIDRVHLVGHDWGAALSWAFASSSPNRLRSLTCMSTGHSHAYREAGPRQREKGWYTLLFQFDIAEQWLLQNDAQNLRGLLVRHPEPEEVVERMSRQGAASAALAIYRAWMAPKFLVATPRAFPPIPVPTMGVWGSEDPVLTEEQMTGSAAHVAGPWRYERIEDAGHWLPLEKPVEINRLLLDFLSTFGA